VEFSSKIAFTLSESENIDCKGQIKGRLTSNPGLGMKGQGYLGRKMTRFGKKAATLGNDFDQILCT